MPLYTIRKRLVSVGRDYNVEDETGTVLFKIDGKVGFARVFLIKNQESRLLLRVREKLLCIDPTFIISREGQVAAIVRRRTVSDALVAKYEVEMNGEVALRASGSFFRDGIHIHRGTAFVGSVSRKPFTVIDEIFHVTTAMSEEQALLVAVAMSIVEITPSRGSTKGD